MIHRIKACPAEELTSPLKIDHSNPRQSWTASARSPMPLTLDLHAEVASCGLMGPSPAGSRASMHEVPASRCSDPPRNPTGMASGRILSVEEFHLGAYVGLESNVSPALSAPPQPVPCGSQNGQTSSEQPQVICLKAGVDLGYRPVCIQKRKRC